MPENNRKDIDLVDVLRGRVEAGQPIFVTGRTGAAVTQNVESLRQQLATETGQPVRIIEVIDLPELPVGK